VAKASGFLTASNPNSVSAHSVSTALASTIPRETTRSADPGVR